MKSVETGFHPIFILSSAIVGDRRVSLSQCVCVCDRVCERGASLVLRAPIILSVWERKTKKNEKLFPANEKFILFFVCVRFVCTRTQLIICCVSWFTTDIPISFPFPFNCRRSNLEFGGCLIIVVCVAVFVFLFFSFPSLFHFPTKKKVVLLLRVCSLLLASCNYQRVENCVDDRIVC